MDKIIKSMETLATFTYQNLYALLSSEEHLISFCSIIGLLPSHKTCLCGSSMKIRKRADSANQGYYFRCPIRNCLKESSIKEGTFFSQSKLSISKIFELMYFVIRDNQEQDEIHFQLGLSSNTTIVDWKNYCRDIFTEYFVSNPTIIGGAGIIVEIDECMLVRRKYNRGRLVREQWIFGGYESSSKRSFFVPVENRNRVTLHNLILTYIRPGSIIMSDEWAAYGNLAEYGYVHFTVNHSENYVDPVTGATTNHVESVWQKLKVAHVKRYGTARSTLDSHPFEFLWRQRFGRSFKIFIEHVNLVYPNN